MTQGALVTADQTAPLATVQQLDPIYVDVNQSSSEWLQLKQEIDSRPRAGGRRGAPVTIVLEDGAHLRSAEGKLQFADVTVDPTTGNFLLRAIVAQSQSAAAARHVRACACSMRACSPKGVLAPQQGITRDPKGNATALVVNADGKVETRDVKVSRTIGDQWLVDERPGRPAIA